MFQCHETFNLDDACRHVQTLLNWILLSTGRTDLKRLVVVVVVVVVVLVVVVVVMLNPRLHKQSLMI